MSHYVEYGYVDHTGKTVIYVRTYADQRGDQDRDEFLAELDEQRTLELEEELPPGYLWTEERRAL